LSSNLAHAFLQCLEKNSRIAGYKFFAEDQKAKIFLSYDSMSRKPLLPKIIYYSLQGRTRIATVKILQEFAKKTPNSLTLISTNRGIMSLKDCLFYQCGGEFLVSLT
jgi:ribosomal protein S8